MRTGKGSRDNETERARGIEEEDGGKASPGGEGGLGENVNRRGTSVITEGEEVRGVAAFTGLQRDRRRRA